MFSKCDNVAHVIDLLCQISKGRKKTLKILDVGCGWGKWGFLFRGWLDVEVNGTNREDWTNKIDACEVFEPCITPAHRYIYDQILLTDFRDLFQGAGLYYNIIIMGDSLEHVSKNDGVATISRFMNYCDHLIISVPGYADRTYEKFGNPAEVHRAYWTPAEFYDLEVKGKIKGECSVHKTGKLNTVHYQSQRKS